MRLTAAFFANRAEIVDGMLDVKGGFWNSITVAPDVTAFRCYTVVIVDVDPEDIGEDYTLVIDGRGPGDERWTPAHKSSFTLTSRILFMCMPLMLLPVAPGGGAHVYTFRLDGQHERVDVPLAVHIADA
jgi:hypothetical protein